MLHLPNHHHNFSLRLSEVLDDIGVNERMIMKRRRSLLLVETIDIVTEDCSIHVYHFGSQSEGTTTIGLNSDEDTLVSLLNYNVIQDYAEWKHGCLNLLMIQDEITPPGYCHLQLIRPDVPLPVTDILNKHCFPDADDRILLKNTELTDIFIKDGAHNSPAWTHEGQPGIRDLDVVPAFPCKSWPNEARDWLNRHLGRWPTADMKRYAANSGCFVVPVGSKVSQIEPLEWRISTSMAERCLMWNLNITQIRCYVLLKMILKTYLYHPVSSFMCKTVLLYCIENTHQKEWQENNLFTCLSYCLKRLYFSILHKSCPHFIIPRNNLMAGQFSLGVKDKLLKCMRDVIDSNKLALFSVQIDDLGQRLQMKMNVMYTPVQNVHVHPSDEISLHISAETVQFVARSITGGLNASLLKAIKLSQRNESLLQHLLQIIQNIIKHYREGTDLKQKAVSLYVPSLCAIIGSVLASFNIGTNNSVSPEALSWLSVGLNSDVSSGRLKIASVFYCSGDFLKTEFILRETERLYSLDTVEPLCYCNLSANNGRRKKYLRVCNNQSEKAVKTVVAFCVSFIPAERNCIPHELQYEMFRSTEEDLLHRDELQDFWMDWAVADSLPFLYFLQYKTYSHLHRYNDQQRALTNLVRTIETERNLGHRETALNLLGQCMEQNRPHDALTCYTTSLNVRERNNVARFHICRLLANMLHIDQ